MFYRYLALLYIHFCLLGCRLLLRAVQKPKLAALCNHCILQEQDCSPISANGTQYISFDWGHSTIGIGPDTRDEKSVFSAYAGYTRLVSF